MVNQEVREGIREFITDFVAEFEKQFEEEDCEIKKSKPPLSIKGNDQTDSREKEILRVLERNRL